MFKELFSRLSGRNNDENVDNCGPAAPAIFALNVREAGELLAQHFCDLKEKCTPWALKRKAD